MLYLSMSIFIEKKEKESSEQRSIQFPNIKVQTLEGKIVSTDYYLSDLPVIVIYFNTGCIFCKSEISEVLASEELKSESITLIISAEPPAVISNYVTYLNYETDESIVFMSDIYNEIQDYYRIKAVPETFLYNSKGKLIKNFKGATSVEKILEHMAKN